MFQVLRVGVGVVGALLLAIGLLILMGGGQLAWSGIQLVVLGAVGLVIALFEKLRYVVRQILSVAISPGCKITLRITGPASHHTASGFP